MSQQASLQDHIPASSESSSSPLPANHLSMLPMELKIVMLASMPYLETLQKAILTVPSLYTAYKYSQTYILSSVLSNELSPEMLGEACSLRTAGLIKRDIPGWSRATKKFIIAYEEARTSGVSLSGLNATVLRDLAARQLSIQKIACEYAKWAMRRNHSHSGRSGSSQLLADPLSVTEESRLYRALYHYEIFSALFGRTPESPVKGSVGFRRLSSCRGGELLGLYTEWELEESHCVRHYIHRFYQKLIKKHSLGLGVKLSEATYGGNNHTIVRTPFHEYLFGPESDWLIGAATHCTALGLDFLVKIQSAKTDAEELDLLKTQAWFSEMINYNQDQDNGWPRLYQRIFYFPPRRRPFFSPYKNDHTGPNPGIEWAAKIHGTMQTFKSVSVRSGLYATLLSWGYAMWDSKRLDKWGILKMDHHISRTAMHRLLRLHARYNV